MIEYLEIINIIKDIKEEAIEAFNQNVSLPMTVVNLQSTIIKQQNKDIIIENKNKKIEISYETRKAYYQIFTILKKINKELYQKIDFKYIDFFGKFKINDAEFELESAKIEDIKFSVLTLQILAVLNIKFWCSNDIERKEFLENMKNKPMIKDYERKEEKENFVSEKKIDSKEKLDIAKNNWWINLLNKFRKLKK